MEKTEREEKPSNGLGSQAGQSLLPGQTLSLEIIERRPTTSRDSRSVRAYQRPKESKGDDSEGDKIKATEGPLL